MSKPLTFSIGGQPTHTDTPATPQDSQPEVAQTSGPVGAADVPQPPSAESLAEIYQILKRHEETLRDMIIEIRLLYHNLPAKEQKRLEDNRARTTHEVGENFAGQLRSLEEKLSRLRASH